MCTQISAGISRNSNNSALANNIFEQSIRPKPSNKPCSPDLRMEPCPGVVPTAARGRRRVGGRLIVVGGRIGVLEVALRGGHGVPLGALQQRRYRRLGVPLRALEGTRRDGVKTEKKYLAIDIIVKIISLIK